MIRCPSAIELSLGRISSSWAVFHRAGPPPSSPNVTEEDRQVVSKCGQRALLNGYQNAVDHGHDQYDSSSRWSVFSAEVFHCSFASRPEPKYTSSPRQSSWPGSYTQAVTSYLVAAILHFYDTGKDEKGIPRKPWKSHLEGQ